jgi:hypothetical protein
MFIIIIIIIIIIVIIIISSPETLVWWRQEDIRPRFKTCAVVSSATHLVPKSSEHEQDHTAHGRDIDRHTMVTRAPHKIKQNKVK